MIRRKKTITRRDRDRLMSMCRAKANTLRWALFADELERQIAQSRVVGSAHVAPDIVTMDSTVRFHDVGRPQAEVYTLVYPDAADLSGGKLSVLSPLGTALLGARKGDVVRVVGAAGPRAIKVAAICQRQDPMEQTFAERADEERADHQLISERAS